jgi:activator of HSP90 ATPase
MDLSKELQKVYTIVYDLASNVKECPECFHDSFDIEIVDDCENIMDILNNIFKFYKI